MATYYVSTSGNDSNDGLSPSAPWQTINSKVNNRTLLDGDAVLFKRGDIWYNTRLSPKNGGTADYIRFGMYGDSGDKPIISAGVLLTAATYEWRLSVNGTNEYYIVLAGGGNPSMTTVSMLWLDDEYLDAGSVGQLLDHQFAYADNDSLGFSTIYVRDNSGNPSQSGVVIVRPGSNANAVYCAKNKIIIENIRFKHGSSDCVRMYNNTDCILQNVVVSDSSAGVKFEATTNSTLKQSVIKNIGNTTFQAVNLSSNSTDNSLFFNEIKNCQGWGIRTSSGGHRIYNNTIVGTRLSAIYNTSAGTTDVKNNIIVGCGLGLDNPVKNSTGTINADYNCVLDGLKLDLAMFLGCTVGSHNISRYPRFIRDMFVGWIGLTMDDWTGGSKAQTICQTYASALNDIGVKLSWFISRTDIIPQSDWDQIKLLSDCGHDMGFHTRGHVEVSPKNAMSIRYTGTGTYCRLYITPDPTNRTVRIYTECDIAGDVFDYICDINDAVNYRLGSPSESHDGIIRTIDNLTNYTASLLEVSWYFAKSFCLSAVNGQDIKTAAYEVPMDMNSLYHEEIVLCSEDMRTNLGLSEVTMAYPTTNLDRSLVVPYIVANCPEILSARTVSPTFSLLMRKIKMYELSCLGASVIEASTDDERRIKAESLACLMTSHGAFEEILTHDLTGWPAQHMLDFAQTVLNMNSLCCIGSQMQATQWIRSNGYPLNDQQYRVYQQDQSDLQIKSDSPCHNTGDASALNGIANLYDLSGNQITDSAGNLIVSNVNIGAYGTLTQGPTITAHPQNSTKIVGQTAQFTVVATTEAGTLHYQWKKGSTNIGTDSDTLSFVTVIGDNGAQITCVITDDNGSTTSNAATLTVQARVLTSIVVSPASTRVAFNKTKQFTANGFDQLGDPISTGTITWTATGGTIDETGLFTAGETAGEFAVTATVGLITKDGVVRVLEKIPSTSYRARIAAKVGF